MIVIIYANIITLEVFGMELSRFIANRRLKRVETINIQGMVN